MSAHNRSQAWFGAEGRSGMVYRSWVRNQGYGPKVFDGRPVIGIASTWSELAAVQRPPAPGGGGGQSGVSGRPAGSRSSSRPFPPGRRLMRPTAMLYRNLLAMEAEELMRANPLDGVVLLSGCDKTTPGLLMAAASVNLPAIMVTGGPDAQREVPRARHRLRHPCLAVRGRDEGRPHDARTTPYRRRLHVEVRRPLHDHGHGVDDGVHGRGPRHAAARFSDLAGCSTPGAMRSPRKQGPRSSRW